jgi:hypothetical protein
MINCQNECQIFAEDSSPSTCNQFKGDDSIHINSKDNQEIDVFHDDRIVKPTLKLFEEACSEELNRPNFK